MKDITQTDQTPGKLFDRSELLTDRCEPVIEPIDGGLFEVLLSDDAPIVTLQTDLFQNATVVEKPLAALIPGSTSGARLEMGKVTVDGGSVKIERYGKNPWGSQRYIF